MKKVTYCILMSLFLFSGKYMFAQGLVINEILTSNTHTNTDEDVSYQDWVELYNNGPAAVNLTGYGLSDDATLPYKWVFPNITLNSGQYLLVWCSDKNRTTPGSPLHTNFKISSGGEAVVLTNAGGTTVDSVPPTDIASDVSYGRLPNGTGSFVFFAAVTPNAVNSTTGYSQVLPPPTFSQAGGFFTTGFSLTLSSTVAGSTIIYTLDGSEPDPANLSGTTYTYKNQYPEHPAQAFGPLLTQSFRSFQYSAPISIVDRSAQPNKISAISSTYHFIPDYLPTSPIFKGTVVRAKLVKSGALSSTTATNTYFVTPLGSNRFSLPVVSLSITEKKLFDYTEGIYVAGVDFDNWRTANPTLEHYGIEDLGNFYRRGIENERVANMAYFVGGSQVINQDVGLRLHGGSSREWQNKSFNVYSRADYGDETMDYPFFPGQPTDFERLVLRNSGADFFETLFRDPLNEQLMKNLHVLTKGYQPTVTFINGEYWGILSFIDKFDDKYFSRVFDIPSGEIDILESENTVEEGDNVDYLNMLNYIATHPLSVQANYDYIATRLDPENFGDYFISNIFFDNIDWPGNNIVYWRKKTAGFVANAPYGHDGRWRWLAHDMDATFGTNSELLNHNSLAAATATNGPVWPNPAWSTFLLRNMLANANFKNDFINRFADLMNTSFLSTRVVATIDAMKDVIAPEINEQIARWEAPFDLDTWNEYLDFEKSFANQRPAFQRDHIRSKFGIASNINATLNVGDASHGYIRINTIDIKDGTDGITGNPYPWTGIYFSNIPVKIKAVAYPGYVFSHWSGASTSTNAEITINSAANFALTAIFVPDVAATSQPIYFWMMDGDMPNNLPLESLATTYKTGTVDGVIQYQSCLPGYPFTSTSASWRKASMERRNSPTTINYIPAVNNNEDFAASDMKGLQIKEPLQSGSLGNTMVFAFPTTGFKDIKLSFAAMNELTNATGIMVDYAVNAGTPVWITTGLSSSTLPLGDAFQLYNIDFTPVTAANNNANFKIRLRFAGTNMTVDNGNRVTFNNIAVHGTPSLAIGENQAVKFMTYPNPFSDTVNIVGADALTSYKVFSIDGKMIQAGNVVSAQISLGGLTSGIYLLQLESDGKTEVKKILKR
jgi:hypothetical protein